MKSLETIIQASSLVNLERLDLSHTLIDNADVSGKLLTTLLPSLATHCPHLEDLDLSNNNLGVPGACAVGEAFPLLVSSKDEFELNLSDTNMSSEAAVKFSDILTSRPCDSLCKCELDLSENQLGIEGLSAIFKIISSKKCPIAKLEISNADLTTPLTSKSTYYKIQLPDTTACNYYHLGCIDLMQFTSCNILKNLNFSDSNIGESGVKSLETTIQANTLFNLERLDLSHTLIDSTDVSGKLLTTLLPSIATHCPHLKKFNLSKNNLGVPGACAVGEAFSLLVSNKDEFDLNLSDTNMSGEEAIKFSDILTSRPCDSLCKCKLDLSENPLGIDGLSAIFKIKFCPIAQLKIRKADFTSQVIFKSTQYNIQRPGERANFDCMKLVQFNVFKYVDLGKSQLGDLSVKSFNAIVQTGGLLNLERLDLSHTLIDNTDVSGKLLTTLLPSLATHCPHLEDLDLSQNNLGVPGACAVGKAFSLLVSNKDEFDLNLSHTNMSGEAAIKFSDILTSRPCDSLCKCALDLSENSFGIDGLSAICKIFSSKSCPVAKLTIRYTDFTSPESEYCKIQCTDETVSDLDLVQFSPGIFLKRLELWRSHLGESGAKALETTIQTGGLFNLERLDLSHTLIDSADVSGKLLTTLLPSIATHCPRLKDLDLSNNNLGVPGACAVGEAFSLLVNKKDKFELNLSDTNMNGEAAVRFSNILTSRPCDCLCKCALDLSENLFGIDGVSAIFKILNNSNPIARLKIRKADFTSPQSLCCNIQHTDENVSSLSCKDLVQFQSCNILKCLDFSGSHIGELGVKSLNTLIQKGGLVNLERLDLSHTLIDSPEVNGKLLTTLLPSLATHCPHLKDLDLSNNNLGVPGACAVGEAFSLLVSERDKLELDLSNSNMGGEAAVKFSYILASRPCPSSCKCELDLSENLFGIDGLSAIFKIIASRFCPIAKIIMTKADFSTQTQMNSENQYFNIEHTDLTASSLSSTDLVQFSSCNILKYVDISDSHISESDVKSLNTAIQTDSLVNLERLDLSHTLIDSADVNGKLLTTLLPSIATHCPHLKNLNLSKNNLGVPGACSVGEAFSLLVSNKDEFELNLSDTNMSSEAAVKFSDILTSMSCDSSCKCELDLSKNLFGIDGLSAICKIILNTTFPIAKLKIGNARFTTFESQHCNVQHINETASNLGCKDSVQFLSCNILKYLSFSDSHIGELGVKSLNTLIQTGGLVNLERLDLSHTLIDSSDVNGKLLTTLLPSIATHCPQLKDLDLSSNNLGIPGACAVGLFLAC